ncbi:MAG: hypothetical protein WAZ21_02945 [Candidatus Saccharimonadales bacterium]
MSSYPFEKRKLNLKVVGIILASIIVLAAAGAGAYFVLRQFKPHEPADTTTTNATTRSGDSTRLKAEHLMKNNDLKGAKAEYEKATAAYIADNNATAAADTQQQIDIINQTIDNTETPEQAPTTRVSGNTTGPAPSTSQ